MEQLMNNSAFVYLVMAVMVFGITQGLKWAFVKPFTNKLSSERARKSINTIIFLFPYAVGLALEYFYATYISQTAPDLFVGAMSGGAGHSVFALYERVYSLITGRSTSKKYDNFTEEQQAVEKLVFDAIADGKIDADDKPALKEFLNKVK
jgi:hypothetical protein